MARTVQGVASGMSLKQKIQEKAKTINELEKILYQKSRYASREFIYEKDKQETWITVDDVTALLGEATKCPRCGANLQTYCPNAKCEGYMRDGDKEQFYDKKSGKWLAVLGADGKEKAKP